MDFEANRAKRDIAEFFICNGRVNELWNSMFTHIRNETVRRRYPDDMPGVLLEMSPDDADKLHLTNGDVVEVRCEKIHLGADTGSFLAVVSRQSNAVPPGMVFAIFSYPAMTKGGLTEFPYREFVTDAYVNNVTTGYVDPINPIAAVKYARGTIRKTGTRYEHSVGGPSYKPRGVAFNRTMVPSEQQRLNWRLRELIVQKGLVRLPLHEGVEWVKAAMREPDGFVAQLADPKHPEARKKFITALKEGRMSWYVDGKVVDGWSEQELGFVFEKWLPSVETAATMDVFVKVGDAADFPIGVHRITVNGEPRVLFHVDGAAAGVNSTCPVLCN